MAPTPLLLLAVACSLGERTVSSPTPTLPSSTGDTAPSQTADTSTTGHTAETGRDTGTLWPEGCSADPFPVEDHVGFAEVTLWEDLPGGTSTGGTFHVGFRAWGFADVQTIVVDPYDGGEDCEITTTSYEASLGDYLDGGPLTWTVGGMQATTEHLRTYYVKTYRIAQWLPTEADAYYDAAPSFGQPDVSNLYGQSVSLAWPGTDELPAGEWIDAMTVPGPIGVTSPSYPAEGSVADLELRWSETGGQRLRFFGWWNDDDGTHTLSCWIDDDGAWDMPADVAAKLPSDLDRFTLERAHRCPRDEPFGRMHVGASVVVPIRLR